MNLIIPQLTITVAINGLPNSGDLEYNYKPFKNLNTASGLSDFTVNKDDLGIFPSITDFSSLDLEVETAYDGSVNMIFSDSYSPPKLVNSRFYIKDSTTYEVADRKGNTDTNIYTTDNLKNQTSLIKTTSSIVNLEYLGIKDGGQMKVGNYTFFFKLADGDDNMTDFVSESGKVVCHIGAPNSPTSIRGGQLDENSEKIIKFKLSNLDLAYNYIRVYYVRTSGSGDVETPRAYFIEDKFKITGSNTTITITGYEQHNEVSLEEINTQFTLFDSIKTISKAQNMTFVGGIEKNYETFSTLEKLSLHVLPSLTLEENIGKLDTNYKELYNQEEGFEYYNTKNIYYKLGYWPEEIYRFGIVYILNDYSLSPVFNIRGTNELTETMDWSTYSINTDILIKDNYELDIALSTHQGNTIENSKGVVRIKRTNLISGSNIYISPVGIKFNFENSDILTTLKNYTKGFFIVRQQRIPDIIAQGVAIGKSTKAHIPVLKNLSDYIYESFLKPVESIPTIGNYTQSLTSNYVTNNILLCPDASLKTAFYNNFFNSSSYRLIPSIYKGSGNFIKSGSNGSIYGLSWNKNIDIPTPIDTKLTLVSPGIELIGDGKNYFSSKAGDEYQAWKHLDPIYGNIEDISVNVDERIINNSAAKVRGIFNTFIGSEKELTFGQYYNIYRDDYSYNDSWRNYFLIRYNDSSAYMSITDRFNWEQITDSVKAYRGDCYINTYAHRMNWNFLDPELPTNNTIIDKYSWFANFRVKTVSTSIGSGIVMPNNSQEISGATSVITYKKVLDAFTYKGSNILTDLTSANWEDTELNINNFKVLTATDKSFKKYSESNGLFGSSKINRPDVNAVNLGHWAVFKIYSNMNLAMRDIDFTQTTEEAIHRQKRSFYPLQEAISTYKLPESNVINPGISKSLSNKYYFNVPDVPFINTNFSNRIYYSNILIDSMFSNGNRVFESKNYQDYSMEYGALVKLEEWYGSLIAVMEHGVLLIPVNERAMMTNASGENVYINTENVLPKNPKVLSNMFGTIFADSIITTTQYIYGLDTIGKKIWRTNGEKFEIISDMTVQKFLNDNINLETGDNIDIVNTKFVKSHYNAFKQDVLFTFKQGNSQWHLCWNELLGKWVTRYTWFPEFSENINNIFYTFANQELHPNASNKLYKHGFAGTESEITNIHPTKWYEDPKTFEFEFVVVGVQGVQKIFDNLKIISNSTEPDSFFYEVVGEGFDWNKDKSIIYGFTTDAQFTTYLQNNLDVKKLPWIFYKPFTGADSFYKDREALGNTFDMSVLRDITIREHNKTKEKLINIYQKGVDIKKYGRLKGNMQYLEDSWDVQIQPIGFKYIYLKDGVKALTNVNEMKIRDKYIKIRVKYNGEQYAIINALKTLFTISYA